MRSFITSCSCALILAIAWYPSGILRASSTGPTIEWTRTIATPLSDNVFGVAVDRVGNMYAVGNSNSNSYGVLDGEGDAFLNKFDSRGNLLWERRIGDSGPDSAVKVAIDAAGNVVIAGSTAGNVGGANAGAIDILLTKFDPAGGLIWTRQIGSVGTDLPLGVSADAFGNIYCVGEAGGRLDSRISESDDLLVTKFDASGNHLWTRQSGSTKRDVAYGVAIDAMGNAFVSGYTEGTLEHPVDGYEDAFVRKYDPSGAILWTRQFGLSSMSYETAYAIAVDSNGAAYLAGETVPATVPGVHIFDQGYVIEYDQVGNVVWRDVFDRTSPNGATGIQVDDAGNTFVAGYIVGLDTQSALLNTDVLLRKYNATKQLEWEKIYGSLRHENTYGIATDGRGTVYVGGTMLQAGVSSNSVLTDGFVTKLVDVPEPYPWLLAGLALVICSTTGNRRMVR